MKLRELQLKDAPFMLEWLMDLTITKNFSFDTSKLNIETTESFIQQAKRAHNTIHRAVVNKKDEYLGTISLKNIDNEVNCAEYAICMRKIAQGKGIATEATQTILKFAFIDLELNRVYLNVLSDNIKAIKLYEKCGFVYEGEFKNHINIHGEIKSLKWFAIMRKDYMKMKEESNILNIMPNRMDRGFRLYQEEFEQKALDVLRSGWYVLGKEVVSFEEEFAVYTGGKCCVGLASGLDALWIAFKVLGIGAGDEVIVQGNTYIASVMGITMNGATPVFVEPDEYFNIDANKIEKKVTKRTKAVLVVHLYGQASNMESIVELAKKYDLRLVEDCAQAHGASYHDKMVGTFGDIGCFSFYPSKNLGAFGDAGAIVTNNEKIAQDVRVFRNYGSEKRYYNKVVGTNSRLDEMQAGLLRVRLSHIQELTQERILICNKYLSELNNPLIQLPSIRENATSVWHQFVIRCEHRDDLMEYLKQKRIGTIIHYPIPPHMAEAYQYLHISEGTLPITERYASEVLSIPLYSGMTKTEQEYVIKQINKFTV